MDTTVVVVIVLALVILVAGAAVWYAGQNRRKGLQERFGPEYEQVVESHDGKASDAERELAERQKRVEKLHIREIEPDQRERYSDQWRLVQTRFVDSPDEAVKEADALVQQVMDARGYPMDGFEQQAADISVDHPEVVSNYRAAHAIADSNASGGASTEDMRQAFIHYRALFAELLGSNAVRS